MMALGNSSWLARRLQGAIRRGLTGAYRRIKVEPSKYLLRLKTAYGLPIDSFREIHSIHPVAIDPIADDVIAASTKVAAAEGAGLGAGGIFTLVPDLGVLSGVTFRMIQKLSLTYGFEYATEGEIAELWIALASAAGVDLGKELIEKEVIERFVPRVIESIALKAGSEFVEKAGARLVPLLSSAFGATLNYYFVRGWGRRAKQHFRERHLSIWRRLETTPPLTPELPARSSH